MIKRILVNGLLTTMVQIIYHIIVLFLLSIFAALIFDSFEKIVEGIGYQVILSTYFPGIMLLTANLLSSLINKRTWTLGLLTIVFIIYFIGWIEDFLNHPFTTILFILIGLTTIFLKFFADKIKGKIGSLR